MADPKDAMWNAALDAAAALHESINTDCDRDRVSHVYRTTLPATDVHGEAPCGICGLPKARPIHRVCGCGCMGALIEYRDAIRGLKRG